MTNLKREIEALQIEKQNVRKELSKAKTMYEMILQRHQYNTHYTPPPKYEPANSAVMDEPLRNDDEFNERLIRTLGLIRWKGEEPAWYKLQFLERARKINPNDQSALREEYARLIFAKKELTERLDRVQGMLKITTEDEKKREDEHLILKKRKENELIRLEETRKDIESTLDKVGVNSGKVFIGKNQRTGEDVYYNDGISVFSMDKSDLFRIDYEENLIDVYLHNFELDPQMVIPALEAVEAAGVNPALMVTVIGINFFNHPTAISQKCFGTKPEVKFQATFAFKCDGFFIEYCKNSNLDLELFYINDHGLKLKFATAHVELQKLLDANLNEKREDYIGVVNTYARVTSMAGQPIGILNYRMKTRLPIYRELQAYNIIHHGHSDRNKIAFDMKYLGTERKLNVKIVNGYGFSPYAKTFVSYRFMANEDTVTQPVEGSNPRFDHVRQYAVVYSMGAREYFINERMEFTVFDDNVPFNARSPDYEIGKLADVVGSGA